MRRSTGTRLANGITRSAAALQPVGATGASVGSVMAGNLPVGRVDPSRRRPPGRRRRCRDEIPRARDRSSVLATWSGGYGSTNRPERSVDGGVPRGAGVDPVSWRRDQAVRRQHLVGVAHRARERSRSCSTSARVCATSASGARPSRSFTGSCLLSHLHWDHMQGLPFFTPLLRAGAELDVYAPSQASGRTVCDVMTDTIRPPLFPITLAELPGEIRFHDVADSEFSIGEFDVMSRLIPHIGRTCGYRVTWHGHSVSYLSDHQQPLRRFVQRHTRGDGVVRGRRHLDPRRAVHACRVPSPSATGVIA